MKAEIIAVGTELLLGDIVNTNAQYLGRRLADLGISVFHQSVVGDNPKRLEETYIQAFQRAELVITTGGLGPTKDDLTKEIGAELFHKSLILDTESLHRIQTYFAKRNISVTESNKKQALIPKGAVVLQNDHGTAPGCIIQENGKILIMLPGPPREMIPMFENYAVPFLQRLQEYTLASKVLRICGIGEAHMEEKIQDLIDHQSNPTIAPYAKDGEVIVRITAKAENKQMADHLIQPIEQEIRERLKQDVYGEGEDSLESVVGNLLIEKGLTIATAESCTGGLLSGRLINYPGISQVFMEGMITYSNEAKQKRLQVKWKTLDEYGAVSEETAKEMAEGIAKVAHTDIGLSVTGIAGPGGGTEEKPVGLVYLGLCIHGEVKVEKLQLAGDRAKVRNYTVIRALDWLRRELLSL